MNVLIVHVTAQHICIQITLKHKLKQTTGISTTQAKLRYGKTNKEASNQSKPITFI
jgi:ribosomal protein L18